MKEIKTTMKKGFTLIELLVVIGVLAVIAAGVVALINPQDKIMQANDAKITNDVGQLATALQAAAAQNPAGTYPATLALLGTGCAGCLGELVTVPNPPAGYAAWTYTGGGTTSVRVCGQVRSSRYTSAGTAGWAWCSSTGRAGAVTSCAVATCP